jgi:hypothetical protein
MCHAESKRADAYHQIGAANTLVSLQNSSLHKGGSSLENLHAMVVGVSHDDAPVAVDGDAAKRLAEFSVA